MLKWLKGSQERSQPDAPAVDLAAIAQQDVAVVFKHSTACPVSWRADREMNAFRASHPQVPFYKVLVREERALSGQIENWTGVEHESPQVIVLRKGKVITSASQGEVTEELLIEAIQQAA